MELIAAREADNGGLAYLIAFNKLGYIIEGGKAERVSIDIALTLGAWGESPTPILTEEMEDRFRKAIDDLRDRSLVREGRKLLS